MDFDAPVGYTEPDYTGERSRAVSEAFVPDIPTPQKALSKEREDEESLKASGNFKAFAGGGRRLDGKDLKTAQAALLEKMPKQPSPAEQAKIWQSSGMSCAGTAAAKSLAAMPLPAKPTFRKPANSKWTKANRAAFHGSGSTLK